MQATLEWLKSSGQGFVLCAAIAIWLLVAAPILWRVARGRTRRSLSFWKFWALLLLALVGSSSAFCFALSGAHTRLLALFLGFSCAGISLVLAVRPSHWAARESRSFVAGTLIAACALGVLVDRTQDRAMAAFPWYTIGFRCTSWSDFIQGPSQFALAAPASSVVVERLVRSYALEKADPSRGHSLVPPWFEIAASDPTWWRIEPYRGDCPICNGAVSCEWIVSRSNGTVYFCETCDFF